MNRGFISFGSNMGDRIKNIEEALSKLKKRGILLGRISKIYETKPYGYTEQENFLNGAVEIFTKQSCEELLKILMEIELELKRVRLIKWGPRTIDLDIIFFNDEIINTENLKVPHPDMQNRVFVLKPLMDICPDFTHPVLKKTIRELYGTDNF